MGGRDQGRAGGPQTFIRERMHDWKYDHRYERTKDDFLNLGLPLTALIPSIVCLENNTHWNLSSEPGYNCQ